MNPFCESVTKMQVCCRSLLAGAYGSMGQEFRNCLEEIHSSLDALQRLISQEDSVKAVSPGGFIHEVHNPMNVVLGYCEIILDIMKINTVQKIYIQILYQTGKDLVLMLDMTYRPHLLHSA